MPPCSVRFDVAAFGADLRRLERKHRDVRQRLEKVIDKIIRAPSPLGDRIQGTDACWKVRVTDDFRLIYQFRVDPGVLRPVALYAKNERSNMPSPEVNSRLTPA